MDLGRTRWRQRDGAFRGTRKGADGVVACVCRDFDNDKNRDYWAYTVYVPRPLWQRMLGRLVYRDWRGPAIAVEGEVGSCKRAKLLASRAIGREFGTRAKRRGRAEIVAAKELTDTVAAMTDADAAEDGAMQVAGMEPPEGLVVIAEGDADGE